MDLMSSFVITLVLIGLFILLYVCGSIMEALEQYLANRRRRKKHHNEKSKDFRRV